MIGHYQVWIILNIYLNCEMKSVEKLRIDKYLWSIRVFKTRAAASAACQDNRVKMNDVAVKASKTVSIGDIYEIRGHERKWKIEVTGLLHQRKAYSEAILYYKDLTPEEDLPQNKPLAPAFYTGKRLSKIGRPTKKNRRDLDDLFGL